MALGGGIWVTQNKVLPGTYINFVSVNNASANLGERGLVAIALPLGEESSTTAGKVVECTATDFIQNKETIFSDGLPVKTEKILNEIFRNATKVFIYDSWYDTSSGTQPEVGTICKALEPYEFNVLACYTDVVSEISTYVDQIKLWRDTNGKKVQGVVYNASTITAPDHEGIIVVDSTVSDADADPHALVAWVAGAEAACAVNASCTNKVYNGSYQVVVDKTQTELEEAIKDGLLVFHLVYGDVRVLEDVNSLTTTDTDKGEDFKNNQTIRVLDQIANDIAKLFNTKYLGVIPNDASGRVSLWSDIVKHHNELQDIRAIQNFDSSLVTVEQGETKKSVVVNDVIEPVNAMAQLYMTVIVQ